MASACSIVLARDPSSVMGGMYPTTDRLGSRATSCILMSVAIVCVCVMVVCGVFVLREYTLANNYEETLCRLANISYSADVICTHCSGTKETNREKGAGGGSTGSCAPTHFPCLHVMVTYRYNGTFHKSAMLYETSLQAVGAYSQCSYSNVCLKTREENQKQVDEYAGQWRSKSTYFVCYFDADDHDKVIAHKTYTRWDVIHSMLWPSLILVLCGALFLHLETRRRGLTFCGRDEGKGAASSSKDQANLVALRETHNASPGKMDKWNGSPSRDKLLHQGEGGERWKQTDRRLSKLSSSMSSLEKMSTTKTGKVSPPLTRLTGAHAVGGGGGGGTVEKSLKRKTASVDRLADVRIKPDINRKHLAHLS